MKCLGSIVLALVLLGLVGCQGQGEMTKQEVDTLKDNLNKPVDVEKIREEYAKQQGKSSPSGAPTEGM